MHFPLLLIALFNAILFGVNFGYFFAFEALWRGQTPGKRACKLRVVRDSGQALDGRAALVRNLLRPIDVFPSFYLVGVIALFWGRQGKRVGDYAAGTMVVKEATPVASTGVRPGDTSRLPPAEGSLVREFLSRRETLDRAARADVARQLADRLAERYGEPRPEDAEAFLERLLRDGHG